MLQTDLNHGFSLVNTWEKFALGEVSVYHSALCARAESLQPCPTLRNPVARQTSLSIGFSRREYWSGLPCPPPGDLPDPGIEPTSPVSPALQVDSLLLSHPGSPSALLLTQFYLLMKANLRASSVVHWTDRHKSVPNEMES